MESRIREALEDDLERWEAHLDWLNDNPNEPDCDQQITETKAIITENKRLLASAA